MQLAARAVPQPARAGGASRSPTGWSCRCARCCPGFRGVDWASLVAAYAVPARLAARALRDLRPRLLDDAARACCSCCWPRVVELFKAALWVLIFVVIAAGDPVVGRARRAASRALLNAMTFPFLRPLRRFIPPLGGTLRPDAADPDRRAAAHPDPARDVARAHAGDAAALTAAPWRREDGAALVLALHVQPGAARTGIAGTHGAAGDARLKLRLAAPPVDGKANAELLRFLAEVVRRAVAAGGAGARRHVPSEERAHRVARAAARPRVAVTDGRVQARLRARAGRVRASSALPAPSRSDIRRDSAAERRARRLQLLQCHAVFRTRPRTSTRRLARCNRIRASQCSAIPRTAPRRRLRVPPRGCGAIRPRKPRVR